MAIGELPTHILRRFPRFLGHVVWVLFGHGLTHRFYKLLSIRGFQTATAPRRSGLRPMMGKATNPKAGLFIEQRSMSRLSYLGDHTIGRDNKWTARLRQ